MITFQKLRWGNCFSYGEHNELDLTNSTVTQILGLNGSGKSSIPLVLQEIVFNKNSKGIKKAKIPNRYLNCGYWMYLSFLKDNDVYEISTDRATSIKVSLTCNGEDISSHTATNTYKTIEEILGVDFKTFCQLIYQSTDASLQFLTATDTVRKKFLIDLLHLEEYTELFEVFKAAARDVSSEVTAIKSKVDTIEKWLSDNKLTDTTILPMLNLDIDTSEQEEEVRQLTTEIGNISEKNKKIQKNNQYKALLEAVDLNVANSIKIMAKQSYDTLQKELGEISSNIIKAKKLLDKLTALHDVCPTCEQSIDPDFKQGLLAYEENLISAERQRESELNAKIRDIKEQNSEFDRKQKIQKDWEELYRSIDPDIPNTPLDGEQLSERLRRVRAELLRAKEHLAETARTNEERTRRNTRIQVIQEQTDEFVRQLDIQIAALKRKTDVFSNLEILKKAFSTNGFIAYKIENLVQDLEVKTNTYLSELSDGRFTLSFVVANDKLNVEITDNGHIIDIEELSTGELARVNTATLIAIRSLMSSISKTQINVLFLDEVISVLDDEGREKLVEILLKEENLNTYLVSHAWTHPLLAKVTVNKVDNISYLEM